MSEMPTDIILLMWRAGSYPIVDGRLGNRQVIFLPEPASHFFRRPLLLADKLKGPAADTRGNGTVIRHLGFAAPCLQDGQSSLIYPLGVGIAPFLT